MKSQFFIVLDRAHIRAYRAEFVRPERPPRLHMVHDISLEEAHLGPQEIYTDEPGSFPVTYAGGSQQGWHQNSRAERHVEIEETRREVTHLAEHIETLLREEKPGRWSLSAPADIHEALIERLDPAIRAFLVEVLPRDLVKIPADQLLEHFER
jgi:Protein required for attachment to host cells